MSSSKAKTSQSSSTNVNTYNQQVGAEGGGTAVGSGAAIADAMSVISSGTGSTVGAGGRNVSGNTGPVTINSLDAQTVSGVLALQQQLAQGNSTDFGNVINYAATVTDASRDLLTKQISAQLSSQAEANKLALNSQSNSNDIIQRTNELFTSGLVRNAGISESTLSETKAKESTKVYIAIAVAALAGVYLYMKYKK